MLAAWRGERTSLEGSLFEDSRFPGLQEPAIPFQRPHPPLAVAAFGQKGLAQAARRGLPYLASPIETFDQIRENLALHREGIADPTQPGHWVTPIMRTVFISEDSAVCRRVVEALAAEGRGSGSGAKLPAVVARAVAAPASERLIVGGLEHVKERLAEYQKSLGMNLLVVRPQIAGADEGQRRASLEQLTGDVIPALS